MKMTEVQEQLDLIRTPIQSTEEVCKGISEWHQEVCERVQHEISIPDDVVVEVKFQDGTSRDLTPEEKIVFIEGMRHVYDHFNTLPIQAVEVPTDAPV